MTMSRTRVLIAGVALLITAGTVQAQVTQKKEEVLGAATVVIGLVFILAASTDLLRRRARRRRTRATLTDATGGTVADPAADPPDEQKQLA